VRLWVLGGFAAAIAIAVLMQWTIVESTPAPLPTLVPRDALFAVVYGSVNDLRASFRGKHAPQREDPALRLVGRPANNPDLDGIAYDRPIARYATEDKAEVILVPWTDLNAFRAAFDRGQENVQLEKPVAIGDYVSLGASARARRGPINPDVVEALESPVGGIARTAEPKLLRVILSRLLMLEVDQAAAIPDAALAFLDRECERFVVGARCGASERDAGRLRITLRTREGALSRAARVAAALDPAALVRCFPAETLALAAGALAAADWAALLGDVAPGDASAAFGVVRTIEGRRPYALLVAIRPKEEAKLRALDAAAASLFWTDPGTPIPFEATEDRATTIRTVPLPRPPPHLPSLWRDESGTAPPVALSVATEGGVFFLAVGSRAESVVRAALAHRRGDVAASIASLAPAAAHPELLAPGWAFGGLALEEGLRALGGRFPLFALVDIGTPAAATLVARFDGAMRIDLRLSR